MFHASTVFLAVFAILIAFAPLFFKAIDRQTTTRVAVVAQEDKLAESAITTMSAVLNSSVTGSAQTKPYAFIRIGSIAQAQDDVYEGRLDGAIQAERTPQGGIDFTFYTGENMAADRTQFVSVGTLAVAILDWTANNTVTGQTFQMPTLDVIAAAGPSVGAAPIAPSDFAGRRIVAIVLLILIFMIVVIYGMWVAAGVVAEKTSRVMELIVAAASARQLVAGKVLGIGAAGMTQYAIVLLCGLGAIAIEEQVAVWWFGPGSGVAPSLVSLTPGLLAAYGLFFVFGFALYALIYAAAGSLVSRPEELQTIALPLSIIAITGYLQAALILTGGTPGFIRFSSFVPFWSPFVMVTRLTVGRVEPWELLLSLGILAGSIVVIGVLAIRVYAAGVLLYGQRAGLATIVRAVREG
jgi:ABC-2 type transport system permease protein